MYWWVRQAQETRQFENGSVITTYLLALWSVLAERIPHWLEVAKAHCHRLDIKSFLIFLYNLRSHDETVWIKNTLYVACGLESLRKVVSILRGAIELLIGTSIFCYQHLVWYLHAIQLCICEGARGQKCRARELDIKNSNSTIKVPQVSYSTIAISNSKH